MMNSLLDYYRMKRDYDTDTIYFEKVKEEDIKICGKTLREVITILNGLEAERVSGMELCMENINKYMELILKEQQESLTKALNKRFGDVDDE